MDGSRSGPDPRLARALELLRSVSGEAPAEAPGPWQSLPGPAEEDPWLVSATDLLIPWEPEGTAAGTAAPAAPGDPWAGYFAPPPAERMPPAPIPAIPAPSLPAGASLGPPGSLEEPLDDATSFAAAECLYGFVHALGRRDVEAALEQVADDYHAIADDRAVDREGLRHRLEALLDERSGGALDVSLAEPPEPIPFVDGLVLIPATLQVDHRPAGGRPTTLLLEWVAVLEETAAGFRLCGLGMQRERPTDPLPARGTA
jgi:hypothetical protein